jgi:CheY-like chemotaxis protein
MKTFKRLLLIDDNSGDQVFFINALKEVNGNISLSLANNGKEAFEKLTLTSTVPDLIISDISMPCMNGYEFLVEIRNNRQFDDIPIIMLSATQREAEADCSRVLGANGFISKPASVSALSEKLRRIFNDAGHSQKEFFLELSK